MPTLREELAQVRARQSRTTPKQVKDEISAKLASEPSPVEEESIRKIEEMNRRHELRQWGDDMKERDVTVPFEQWRKRAWSEQLKGLKERIESGGAPPEAGGEPTRGPGLQAPMREEGDWDSIHEPFDEFGQRTPTWQPEWISDVTGGEPMRYLDLWNEMMRGPREVRGDVEKGLSKRLEDLRRRIGF